MSMVWESMSGRLREDTVYDWKFVGLSHNTVRGAAGGAVLCAELLKAQGYINKEVELAKNSIFIKEGGFFRLWAVGTGAAHSSIPQKKI